MNKGRSRKQSNDKLPIHWHIIIKQDYTLFMKLLISAQGLFKLK